MWDLTGTGPPRVAHRPHRPGFGVAVSGDGRTAVSGGDDGTLRVWDLTGTDPPRVLTGHTYEVAGVAVSGDGRTAVSCAAATTARCGCGT